MTNSGDKPYGNNPITVDVLKTWIPIGLTIATITIGLVSTVTGMLLTNTNRLARLEVQVEQIQQDSTEMKQTQRETNQLLQRMYSNDRRQNGD